MAVKTYSPSRLAITVNHVLVTGFSESSIVSIEFEDDAFTKVVGADGEVARTRSANKSARVTLTLLQTSSSNFSLSTLATLDRETLGGVFTIGIVDLDGGSNYISNEAWIVKQPDVEFGDEIGEREWMIDCAVLTATTVGN